MLRRSVRSPPLLARSLSSTSTSAASSMGSGRNKITENDVRLREDVRLLGSILGDYIKSQNAAVFEAVENLRKLARQVCAAMPRFLLSVVRLLSGQRAGQLSSRN